MKNKLTAWIFDIDGVLTHPEEKHIVEPTLLTLLAQLLTQEDLVAFNTGRSTAWMIERVITPLRTKLVATNLLRDFMAVGEKGGTWLTFDEKGAMLLDKDEELTVSQDVSDKIKKLVETTYNDAMFFDATKETMVSVEVHDNFDLNIYHERQKSFVKDIEQILAETGTHEQIKIDASIIATDIEDKRANKALGISRFLTFLNDKQIAPTTFITFGDSKGDLAMADELFKRGKTVTFVFVGEREKLQGLTRDYPIIFIAGYSQGTLLFLEKELKGLV